MVMLLSEKYYKIFSNNVISWATLYYVSVTLMIVVLSYALAFGTSAFWITESLYYDKPIAQFTGDIAIEAASTNNKLYIYSTNQDVMQSSSANNLPAQIKFSNTDAQSTLGTMISVSLSIPCIEGQNYNKALLAVGIKYRYRETKIEMVSPILIDLNSYSIGGAIIDGDIKLRQRSPLRNINAPNTVYNTSMFEMGISEMYRMLENRNMSLGFEGIKIVNSMCADTAEFEIKLRVGSEEPIRYFPLAMEALKYGWIEYMSILFPLYVILNGLYSYVLRNQILTTRVKDEHKQFKKMK